MKVLPLKSIWPEDIEEFGLEIINLVKLYHHGLPIPDGLAVSAPVTELEKVFKLGNYQNPEVLMSNFGTFSEQALKIGCPEKLLEQLPSNRQTADSVWKDLLKQWLEELKSLVHRQIKDPGRRLTAKYCLFTNVLRSSGKIYYSKEAGDSQIVVDQGNISPYYQKQLDDYLTKLRSIFLLSYSFNWVLDTEIKFCKVEPMGEEVESVVGLSKEVVPNRISIPLATKVFVNIQGSYVVPDQPDGLVIDAELIGGSVNLSFLLVEAATSFPNTTLIFKLADRVGSFGGSRGSYRLLHDNDLLESLVESFLTARNKKGLLNVAIGVPFVRSVDEFNRLKQNLSAIGVSRKGSLKLWMEAAVPENVLNLEGYLISGLDGVILNLDELHAWVGGFNPAETDSAAYKFKTSAVRGLLEGGLKLLSRSKVPVLAGGKLIEDEKFLKFLVKNGILGVIVDGGESAFIKKSLAKVESEHIKVSRGEKS